MFVVVGYSLIRVSFKVGDINIIINDATDPEKVGNVVVEKLTDIAVKLNNRIK